MAHVYYIDGEVPRLSRTPQYPATLCKIEYLDEGGANIVWRISVNIGVQAPARLQHKLLRLRKNLRHVQPAEEQLKAFNDNFRDLFPQENLIQHELIRLDDGIVPALNDLLRKLVRPSRRAQDVLFAEEQYGMLITDMSAVADGEVLLQLKPKWLVQSPNAPPSSRRCRTCALRAQRLAKGAGTATDEQRNCPLMLVSPGMLDRQKAAQSFTVDFATVCYLSGDLQNLLNTLRDRQSQLDHVGVLNAKGVDGIFDLCRAMTLRDCTLYVRRIGNAFEARLGDLDLKRPEKLSIWKSTERALIEEGWFTNTEAPQHFTREFICALSKG